MQMRKILGILLAFCFLMSVTAAAVSADPRNDRDIGQKTKAVDDKFKLDSKHNSANVLDNDKGKDLKVIWESGAKGKVDMERNGKFTYKPYKSDDKIIKDSFKYAIKGKDGKTSIATVKITFENKKNDKQDKPDKKNDKQDKPDKKGKLAK